MIPGTASFGRVIAGLARQLLIARDERDSIAAQLTTRLEAHPLAEVLTSMPGVGVRTAITVLVRGGDSTAFPTAAHLAAYAGLAPVTRRSGSSIRGESASRRGNKPLKRAPYLSAFASLRDPTQRAGPTTTANEPRQDPHGRPALPRSPPHRRPPSHDPHQQLR